MASIWGELKRRNVVKVAVAYTIAAWLLAQLAEFATDTFDAPDWVLQMFAVFLVLGLPVALILAWAYELTPSGLERTKDVPLEESITHLTGQKLNYIVGGLLVGAIVGSGTVWLLSRDTDAQWVRDEAIPQIRGLLEDNDYSAAFALAQEAARHIPDDPTLLSLWQEISVNSAITTTPPGADVYVREYSSPDQDWTHIGQTSIDNVTLPRSILRWRIEMEGFETVERVYASYWDSPLQIRLATEGSIPPRMVQVPRSDLRLTLTGYDYQARTNAPQYLIDRYEVTNEEYKEFVDAGGYEDPTYWQHEFIDDGEVIPWEEAMAQFRDATERPGPATWEVETYPEGKAKHPVGGVSWYEAAAYAEFRGKSLPTVYHWVHAAGIYGAAQITPIANFDGAGPVMVGSNEAMSPYGTYDMAGNAREWVQNAATGRSDEHRFVLGGSWEDPAYRFSCPETRPPFDRSALNGFRCVEYLDEQSIDQSLFDPIGLPFRDFERREPVSDSEFQYYLSRYEYDRTPLEEMRDSTVQESEYWRRERVTFNAAYGNERMSAYIYLPVNVEPSYQAVIYFPGTGAVFTDSFETKERQDRRQIDFIIQSGRALVWPIYKSTIDRRDDLTSTWPSDTRSFTDHVIQWTNDTSRTIDYLDSRDDIDTEKLAYYGFSWGGRMGAIIPAVERRFKAVVLVAGALSLSDARPEANQVNFAPRITAPVLMLNGRHDFIEPVETAQEPLFELLGTPDSDKKHIIFEEAGHTDNLPRSKMIREILGWLDQYLGPVN